MCFDMAETDLSPERGIRKWGPYRINKETGGTTAQYGKKYQSSLLFSVPIRKIGIEMRNSLTKNKKA